MQRKASTGFNFSKVEPLSIYKAAFRTLTLEELFLEMFQKSLSIVCPEIQVSKKRISK